MKLLSNLTVKDKRALMLYLAIVLLCATFFAAGIFIGYSTPQSYAANGAGRPMAGFIVRVMGLDSAEAANELSAALRTQKRINTVVETGSGARGHVVKVGPLATRTQADDLSLALRNAGYSAVTVPADAPGR